jgi:hypothetical protein
VPDQLACWLSSTRTPQGFEVRRSRNDRVAGWVKAAGRLDYDATCAACSWIGGGHRTRPAAATALLEHVGATHG